MKKLMITLAVAASAAVGNAALVNWGAGTVLEPSGATANKSVTGYLFVIDAATYTALTAFATDGSSLSSAVWSSYGNKLSEAYASGTTSKRGALTLIDDSKSYSAGETAYAALIYTYGTGDSLQYIGNVGSAEFSSAMDVTMDAMALNIFGDTTKGATAWSTAAVPEPTSGLLLLLGMAGLALKHKRA